MNGSGPGIEQPANIKPESSPTGLYSLLIFVGILFIFLWALIILNYFNLISLSSISPTLSILPQKANIVGQVGDKRITTKDLVKEIKLVWGVYAEQQEQDEQSQQNALKKITEREIIEQEAKKLGISVSEDEINTHEQELISQAGGAENYNRIISGNGWTLQDQREKIKGEMLKKKITNKVIAWRIVEKASGFNSTLDPNFEENRKILRSTLEKIRNEMLQGKSVRQAVSDLNDPEATKNLGTTENEEVRKSDQRAQEFRDTFFSLHKGDISEVVSEPGGASLVARILDENDSPYASFEDWLNSMKVEYTEQ